MSGTYSAVAKMSLVAKDTQSDDNIRDTTDTATLTATTTFSDGTVGTTATNTKAGGLVVKAAANDGYAATRTLAAGANESLDLSGVLKDAQGNTLSFTAITSLTIINTSLDCTLVIGNGSNPFLAGLSASATITLRPMGSIQINAPDATALPVTAATGDILKIAAGSEGAGPVTYEICAVGRRP